ncbi:heteromeric transposase endonuclease subunit TnsA [Aeromonas salmonicida subsp. achromogenes]|uniref:heteromeric transposase endonuclease subunit TnsA n=1 Tax=Aeromonas salmonicida TaxID=645 RepID=UPI00037402F3|nr:heteromeric transposase endonuclease subunit TnsA [Aeromonas salmonicida]TMX09886.1 heteromeric transposase endonuclease subunit TnsA [Aeromonas salmonicida subsp. achromogenes]TMX12301.1 heteromeric transposase endonuclease subunit TnsA [Aeromonas salmonicida subsp. achromogenes]TMX12962.1 heteromeric transposase endonuclease subunit TnsA [Aeromonas salmonicida subsp. achromogenes]TMX19324.1 heteromeric transposase endonuclease subunit TnsA [Aeromonas salmonicida subsp. achromogenes]
MAKSKYVLTEKQITKRIKEGRGAGRLSHYRPWLYVNEVPSEGRSQRFFSHLTGRIHHVLSDLEFAVFLLLDHNSAITDIREQFPLNREDTLNISKEGQLWHPSQGGVNLVMSSDFLVNSSFKTQSKFAIQAKYSNALKDPRTVEKLEIERRYWQLKKIPWFLVTEKEIDKVVVSNIDWLHGVKGYFDEIITDDLMLLFQNMKAYFEHYPNRKVIDICKEYDKAYGQELGDSLFDLRLMCASRLITFDIRYPFHSLRAGDLAFRGMAIDERPRYVAS